MNLAELIAIWVAFVGGNSKYVNGLDAFLKKNNVTNILDAGAGTGFPIIGLKKLGWDVTYSDSSNEMLEFFKRKLKESKLEIPYYISNWLDLSKNIPKKFDAVLCRGNTLIYVDSWGENRISDKTKDNIKHALQEFYKMLNENGLLYVDITNKAHFNESNFAVTNDFGEKIINGKKTKMSVEFNMDFKKKIRIFKPIITIDGKRNEFSNYAYLLTHNELEDLLKEVGFKKVEEIKIDGENHYAVFVAYK